jgi:hypothetical protein
MAAKKTTGRVTKKTKKLDLEPASQRELEPTAAQAIELGPTPAQAIELGPTPAQAIELGPTAAQAIELGPTPAQVIETFEVAAAPATRAAVEVAAPPVGGGAIPVAANDWVAVVYEGAAPHFDHDAGTFVRGTRTRLRAGLARRLLGRDGFRLA